ncbi:hypothetical protein T439DRAFT_355021 [Meredithblackwellia eburnea MCA 4105]
MRFSVLLSVFALGALSNARSTSKRDAAVTSEAGTTKLTLSDVPNYNIPWCTNVTLSWTFPSGGIQIYEVGEAVSSFEAEIFGTVNVAAQPPFKRKLASPATYIKAPAGGTYQAVIGYGGPKSTVRKHPFTIGPAINHDENCNPLP